jgi:alpha-maltose-1-phosphate synthase
MACQVPVVASDVGGIPEVVEDGVTGILVHYDPDDPDEFEAGMAAAVNELAADPERSGRMGRAGRERAVREFDWTTIAQRTVELYQSLL